jgi:hypothetical protein
MTQNKTLAVAVIGVVIILLLICAGTALIVSAVMSDSDAGAQATATLPVAVETDALPGTEVAAATDAVAATDPAGDNLPPPGMTELPTSTPLPTNTPEPTPLPTATPLPTEPPPTPTNTRPPVVLPTNPPPPPQPTVAPTNTPGPPPPPPPQSARGLTGTYFGLHDGQSDNVAAGQPIWFHFTVANSSGAPVPFGGLGVLPRKGGADRFDLFQASWGNDQVGVNGLDWIDHIDIGESGSYTLRLAVCFDVTVDQCRQGQGNWATLSGEIPVTVR